MSPARERPQATPHLGTGSTTRLLAPAYHLLWARLHPGFERGQSVSSESLCQQRRSHSTAGKLPTPASSVTGQGSSVNSGGRRPARSPAARSPRDPLLVIRYTAQSATLPRGTRRGNRSASRGYAGSRRSGAESSAPRILETHCGSAGRDVVKVAAALVVHRRVPRFFGDKLIASRADALGAVDLPQLEHLGSGMSSWGEVDCFSCYLSGPAWREGQIEDKAIVEWARSRNRWWRRAALVSTVPLNVKARGGRGDARRTLLICRLLMTSAMR